MTQCMLILIAEYLSVSNIIYDGRTLWQIRSRLDIHRQVIFTSLPTYMYLTSTLLFLVTQLFIEKCALHPVMST